MQYILPFFALVLGQSYQEPVNKVFRFEALFLYILLFILPFEIIATFIQDSWAMTPFLYIFSLYQHMQYLPLIFVSMYFLAATSLHSEANLRFLLVFLAPAVGVYALMSASFAAIVLTVLGSIGLVVLNKKARKFSICISFFILMGMLLFGMLADNPLLKEKLKLSQSQSQSLKGLSERQYYWSVYWQGVTESPSIFLFGHVQRPDREKVPSAHNYYLDYLYNFGFVGLIPLLIFIVYTLLLLYRHMLRTKQVEVVSLGVILLFILLVDNSLKVGLRQPYPGMITFFLWGILINRLFKFENSNEKEDVG
jgi:O-antigen ligase